MDPTQETQHKNLPATPPPSERHQIANSGYSDGPTIAAFFNNEALMGTIAKMEFAPEEELTQLLHFARDPTLKPKERMTAYQRIKNILLENAKMSGHVQTGTAHLAGKDQDGNRFSAVASQTRLLDQHTSRSYEEEEAAGPQVIGDLSEIRDTLAEEVSRHAEAQRVLGRRIQSYPTRRTLDVDHDLEAPTDDTAEATRVLGHGVEVDH